MEIICPPDRCTGCMACRSICPRGAITAKADAEGFMRPYISQSLCVDCGMCVKACPVNHPTDSHEPVEAYSGWIADEAKRMASSSGGAFTAIAEAVIAQGGAVFGAALDGELRVSHICAESLAELPRLRGSKYSQSDVENAYRHARRLLADGRTVLFTGTPCQIAGLRSYMSTAAKTSAKGLLLTAEVVCHGVPSPRVFEEWKQWFASRHDLKSITSVGFRGKRKSWIFYNMDVKGVDADGKPFAYEGAYFKDAWIRGFLSDNFLRPSCYGCAYAQPRRCADFTLGDWWDYKRIEGDPSDFEQKGVSMVLCNTDTARDFFRQWVVPAMEVRQRKVADALATSQPLRAPFPAPASRKDFWTTLRSEGFGTAVCRFMRPAKPNVNQRIIMAMRPSRVRSLTQNIYYKVRDLGRILRGPQPAKTIADKLRKKLKWKEELRFRRAYSQKVAKAIAASANRRSVYLFCAPIHSNLGDQAQTMCIMRLAAQLFPSHEVVWIPYQLSSPHTVDDVKKAIGPDDIVLIHSGYLATELYGYLPVMCEIATKLRDNPIVILPQTVNIATEEMRRKTAEAFNSHPRLTLMCRDDISYENAKQMFTCKLELRPDVVTTLIGQPDFQFDEKREGVLMVIRDDKEKLYPDEEIAKLETRLGGLGEKVDRIDTTLPLGPFAWPRRRNKIIADYLRRFARYKLVITDRYHGTIFAQIASTPTVVISSADHKLSSGVRWFPSDIFAGRLYYASSLEEASLLAEEILSRPTPLPLSSAPFLPHFKSI